MRQGTKRKIDMDVKRAYEKDGGKKGHERG